MNRPTNVNDDEPKVDSLGDQPVSETRSGMVANNKGNPLPR